MTVKDLKKLIDKPSSNVEMTLMNKESEAFPAGQATKVTHTGSKLKMHWPIEPQSHGFRFNFAVFHRGEEILLAKEITPISLSSSDRSIELVLDYNS